MNSAVWLANLVAWWLQAGAITAVAALWLRLMPVRSPRAMLFYLQGLLGICLLLPALEPWRAAPVTSRISAGAASTVRLSGLSAIPISIPSAVLVVLGIGIAVRLIWLAAGYWRLRSHGREAWPAGTEIAALQEKLGIKTEVYVSGEISGPVTFGFQRPIVLLPACWPDLDPASRTAIAYHEFLHIRRNDWAFHVGEEIIRALLWFHPAIWWLTAEIRLAREQVVDGLVAGFSGGPKPYAKVLLAFSGIDSAVTAAAFTQQRHLARRIQFLLEEVTMTKSRMLVSFASITLCLFLAGAVAVWSFPLESVESNLIAQDDSAPAAGVAGGVIGRIPGGVEGGVAGGVNGGVASGVAGGVAGGIQGERTAAAQQNPKLFKVGENGVTAPKVVSKVDPEYTKEARDAKIEGTVVVQTEIHPDKRAHNTTVIRSLDTGLDRNVIEAISHWEFQPATKDGAPVAVRATIEVNYKLN